MNRLVLSLLLMSAGISLNARAADSIAVQAGHGDATDTGQVSYVRPWESQWFTGGTWYLTGYWEASIGRWRSSAAGGQDIWDFGLTPVFRFRNRASTGIRPYFDGAIGAHFIDHTHVNTRRDMGSAFQFGDHLGAGILFGDRAQFDLGYRFQHVSNADIKRPNDGINFQQIRFAWEF